MKLIQSLILIGCVSGLVCAEESAPRSKAHDAYAKSLWKFLHRDNQSYKTWKQSDAMQMPVGPKVDRDAKMYLNSRASQGKGEIKPGATYVVEHRDDAGSYGVSIWYLPKLNYDPGSKGWYWANFTANGKVVKTSADHENPFDKRGYYTTIRDGRLWVFQLGSTELSEFVESGSYEKHVTLPGEGPGGITVKGASSTDVKTYLTAKEGFVTGIDDGRLWVFKEGTPEASEFLSGNISDKHVTRIGAGPQGMTIKAADIATIDAYLHSKSGFETRTDDGRMWIFRASSEELKDYDENGRGPDKHITRIGVGPNGETVKSPNAATIDEYFVSAKGFQTFIEDGRLWVFTKGSPELDEYLKSGEPAKCVTRIGEGPLGMTVKSSDASVIDQYLAVIKQ